MSVLTFTSAQISVAMPPAQTQFLCDQAARYAAKEHGVPTKIMLAISRAESGRRQEGVFGPWPWTINRAGRGSYLDTRAEALEVAHNTLKKGKKNIDIGCFQLNFYWHGAAFSSLEAMFDPMNNALYAADFLRRLYAEKGNWDEAIGAYHSRKIQASRQYLERVSKLMANLSDLRPPIAHPAPPPRISPPPQQAAQNQRFMPRSRILSHANGPLLRAASHQTASGALGSLMSPAHSEAATPLILR